MTVLAHRAPLPPSPTRGWEQRAACRDVPAGLDLTELTDAHRRDADRSRGTFTVELRGGVQVRSWAQDLAAARQVCGGCPVLAECRLTALAFTDVAGFVGGMTEEQRETWRTRRRVRVRPLSGADVVTVDELTPVFVAEQVETGPAPARRGHLPDAVVTAILRLSAAGLDASEIASRLAGVEERTGVRVTETTVAYVRQTFHGSKTRRRRTA